YADIKEMRTFLAFLCATLPAGASISYSNTFHISAQSGGSPTLSVSNGSGSAVIDGTLQPAAGQTYTVHAEICGDGLCTGQPGPANPLGFLRLTNLTITCDTITPGGSCLPIEIDFSGTGGGLLMGSPFAVTETMTGTQTDTVAVPGNL